MIRRTVLLPFAALVLACANSAMAADADKNTTTIELSAEANRSAPNDLARATVFLEGNDAKLPELSKRINQAMSSAIALAKPYTAVKTQSGGTNTWADYGRNGGKIEGWRMRSELVLETRDTAALSELIGKLQGSGLALGQIAFLPAPETRKKAEDDTVVDAIAAFRARADVAAGALGRKYRIRQLTVSTQGGTRPPMYRMAKPAVAMSSDAVPPSPIETGESQITVNVNGQIELQ
ncbi:SIMPL domain-containing protein [Niveibacterium sp. SC-1]|uniref:SIMPL domain-containing protein n=1 Tax=Niveibacterium sp. SC-1 TaxID=3135646 RepID=UPI00311E49C6